MDVLGIEVGESLVRCWGGWLAPEWQPFFLSGDEVVGLGLEADRSARDLSAELRDTYEQWNVAKGMEVVWLDEQGFHEQPSDVRASLVEAQVRHGRGAVPVIEDWADILDAEVLRKQADGHRFVWWPSLVEPRLDAVLTRVVSDGQLPCRRTSVPEEIWRAAEPVLPRARELSGTFATGSRGGSFAGEGPTFCFSAVMAATGVQDSDHVPFEPWLAANCTDGGRDELPGTVLVWRNADGNPLHAAVTLGGGWGLHKPGQEWLSPRQVLAVHDLHGLAPPGLILERYTLG